MDSPNGSNAPRRKFARKCDDVSTPRTAVGPPRKLGALQVVGVRGRGSSLHIGRHILEKRTHNARRGGGIFPLATRGREEVAPGNGGSRGTEESDLPYLRRARVVTSDLRGNLETRGRGGGIYALRIDRGASMSPSRAFRRDGKNSVEKRPRVGYAKN